VLRRIVAASFVVAALAAGGTGTAQAQACGTTTTVGCLTAGNVMKAVQGAATAISFDTMVIAVVDRAGTPLAVFRKAAAPAKPAPEAAPPEAKAAARPTAPPPAAPAKPPARKPPAKPARKPAKRSSKKPKKKSRRR